MNTNNSGFAAFRIVATYVFLALIWIASSDTLLVKGISGANTRALWGMGKGFVFVAVTATVLFTLVSRRLRERDVALASQAQALVKEQAASHMLKELVRISAFPLMICDLQGKIISINSEAIRVSGISENAVAVSFDVSDRLADDAAGWFLNALQTARGLSRPETVLETVDVPDGQATMRIFRGPLLGKGQLPIGYFVLANDLTEQMQIQARQKESEIQYKRMFDGNPHPMWLHDQETLAFLAVNEAAVAQYGYSHAEFLGMTAEDLLDAGEAERLAGHLSGASVSGIWRHRARDGREIHAEIISNEVRHGGRDARLVLARDVTAALKLEQALTASQKQLGELTQRLLVQDQLTTRRVAQALHDDLGQRLFACAVLLEAESTSLTHAQLLATHQNVLSQLQAAMKSLRTVLVGLRPPMLEDLGLVQALRHEIDRLPPHVAHIDLLDFTGGLRWGSHLEYGAFMIAREALRNAIEHAQARRIGIRVKGAADALWVSVEDDGRGIPDELLVGRPGHLGITGMRERAASMGGTLRITSAPDVGARVSLELRGAAV
jgi:PAS domain S-box-containing protein